RAPCGAARVSPASLGNNVDAGRCRILPRERLPPDLWSCGEESPRVLRGDGMAPDGGWSTRDLLGLRIRRDCFRRCPFAECCQSRVGSVHHPAPRGPLASAWSAGAFSTEACSSFLC